MKKSLAVMISAAGALSWISSGAAAVMADPISVGAEVEASVSETGQAILQGMTGMDFSWLSDLVLCDDITFDESTLAHYQEILLNGISLLAENTTIDFSTGDLIEVLPDYLDGLIHTNLYDLLLEQSGLSLENVEAILTQTDIFDFSSLEEGDYEAAGSLPQEDLSSLIDTYGPILAEFIQVTGTEENTISLYGIDEEVTTCSFEVNDNTVAAALTDLFAVPIEDSILSAYCSTDIDFTGTYSVSEDGTPVAFSYSLPEEDGTTFDYVAEFPMDEETGDMAFIYQVSDDQAMAYIGGYVYADSQDEEVIFDYNGTDYIYLAGSETSDHSSSVQISFPFMQTEDETGLVFQIDTDCRENECGITAALLYDEEEIASLSGTLSLEAEAVEPITMEEGDTVYEITCEDDAAALLEEIDLQAIADKLAQAGVPEEFLGM